MPKKDKRVNITIRVYEELRKKIERAATGHGQSMNAEMIERLQASFLGERLRASKEFQLRDGHNMEDVIGEITDAVRAFKRSAAP